MFKSFLLVLCYSTVSLETVTTAFLQCDFFLLSQITVPVQERKACGNVRLLPLIVLSYKKAWK